MKQWVSKKFLNIPEGNGCICICRSHTHGINDDLFLLGKILNNLVWKYQNKQTFKMSSSNSFDFFKRSNIFSMATTVRTWRSCEKKCQTDAPKKSFQSRCYTKMVPYWYILNNDARIVIYGTVCFILTKTATFMISLQFLSTVLNRLHDKQNQNRSCWAEYIVL